VRGRCGWFGGQLWDQRPTSIAAGARPSGRFTVFAVPPLKNFAEPLGLCHAEAAKMLVRQYREPWDAELRGLKII